MVRVLAFYFDDPNSNPAEAFGLPVQMMLEKNKIKQKEAWVGPFFKKQTIYPFQRPYEYPLF